MKLLKLNLRVHTIILFKRKNMELLKVELSFGIVLHLNMNKTGLT